MKFLASFDFSLFDFYYFENIPIPYLEEEVMKMGYTHPYKEYRENGYSSGSFFVSEFQLVKTIIAILILHIIVFAFWKLACRKKRLSFIETPSIYIRMFLEAFLFSFLVASNEVFRAESAYQNLASYTISILYSIAALFFVIFILGYYKLKKDITQTQFFTELFEGLKDKHLCKLYHFFFLLRRLLIVCVVLFMRDLDIYTKTSVFFSFQLLSLAYVVIYRPFIATQGNLIDIIND